MIYFFGPLLILAVIFFVLAKLYGLERAFLFLSLVPVTILLLFWIYEKQKGADIISGLVLAVSFTSSVIIAFAGIVFSVRAIILRRGIVKMLIATCLASIPMLGLLVLTARTP